MAAEPARDRPLPAGLGLWSGFLDRMPTTEAIAAMRDIDDTGIRTIWLQEFSGVDPFVRAALYLQATRDLTVALGVAAIHARDPEAMVAAAAALHEAFPGRFALGLGASHRHLAEARGGAYHRPLTATREYLTAHDRVLDAVVVRDEPGTLRQRLAEQHEAGADHVVVQFIPPPPAAVVLERITTPLPALG